MSACRTAVSSGLLQAQGPELCQGPDGLALIELLAALNPQHEMGWGGFVLLRSHQDCGLPLLLLLGKEGKRSALFTEI